MMPFPRGNRPSPFYYYPPAGRAFSPPPQFPNMSGRAGRGLLGRLAQGAGSTGFERAGTAGAQKLTNPANLQQILANTQQVLKTVQQIGPMVEQYGPMVKNLPSMWKLYKGLKSLPDEKEEEDSTNSKSEPPNDKKEKQKAAPAATEKKMPAQASEQPPLETKPKSSSPKLYI